MKVSHVLAQIGQYLSEAILWIFTPSQDIYPLIGTQAFDGDTYQESSH